MLALLLLGANAGTVNWYSAGKEIDKNMVILIYFNIWWTV
jgi:hypothetical protein